MQEYQNQVKLIQEKYPERRFGEFQVAKNSPCASGLSNEARKYGSSIMKSVEKAIKTEVSKVKKQGNVR